MSKLQLSCNPTDYKVQAHSELDLANFPTTFREKLYVNEDDYDNQIANIREKLEEEAEKLYAGKGAGILVILQGMDTSGKDGVFRNVFGGIALHRDFKAPTQQELSEHFLERIKRVLPNLGDFTVFNRSQYEDVLVVYVHPELLDKRNPQPTDKPPQIWQTRYSEIRELEAELAKKGVSVIKFMLHVSPQEQLKRLEARVNDPEKHYKVNEGDFVERSFFDKYWEAYGHALPATSTISSPWYVVPADDKKSARLFIGHVVLDKIKSLGLSYPRLTNEQQDKFRRIIADLKRGIEYHKP